jgi:two-component system sporulation sensor kinase A
MQANKIETIEMLRNVIEASPTAIVALDTNARLILWNPAAERVFGWKKQEVIGQYNVLVPEEFRNEFGNIYKAVVEDGETVTCEVICCCKDRTLLKNNLFTAPIYDAKKNIVGVIGVLTIAKENTKFEDVLQLSELHYRTVLNSISDAVHVVDENMRIVLSNDTFKEWCKILEFKGDITGKKYNEVFSFLPEKIFDQYDQVFKTGKIMINEESTKVNERVIETEARKIPIYEHGKVKNVLTIIRDITDQKKISAELRESKDQYKYVSELMSDYIYAYDIDEGGKITHAYITGALEKITGYTQAELDKIGGWEEIIYPEDKVKLHELRLFILTGHPKVVEYRIINKKDEIRWMRDYSRPVWDKEKKRIIKAYGAVKDITKRKKSEFKLIQSHKLASIGQLAAGVAHEINNPLSALSGEIQWQMEKCTDKVQNKSYQFMLGITDRISAIISSLLIFSRESTSKIRKLENINDIIDEMLLLMERHFSLRNIEIKKDFIKDPPSINVCKGEIEQVVMNILFNSMDAMPDGGEIAIKTEYDGVNVCVDIKDDGTGLKKKDLSRVFDPFFTTKDPGKGTGLGLAITHGIISNHGGSIEMTSREKKGSKTTIKLPVTQ